MQPFASWQPFETYEYQYAGILMSDLIGSLSSSLVSTSSSSQFPT